MRAVQAAFDLFHGFVCGCRAHFGFGASAKPLCGVCTQLDVRVGARIQQRLAVSIGHNEIHTLKVGFDHVVDSVPARAANPNNNNAGFQFDHHGLTSSQLHVAVASPEVAAHA